MAVRERVADEISFLFTDHQGSVVSSWNDTTDTRVLTRYFPYGGERHSTAEMPQDQRYTGQVSDATANASGGSGLLYYNARYYDPATAQFTQPDTIVPDPSSPGDLNRCSYVRGNSARYNDPTGHVVCARCGGPGVVRRVTPPDTVLFLGGTMVDREDDAYFARALTEASGREVVPVPPGAHRPAGNVVEALP